MQIILTQTHLRQEIEHDSRHAQLIFFSFLLIVLIYVGMLAFLYGGQTSGTESVPCVASIGAGGLTGNAFLADSDQGLLLTAAHLVAEEDRIKVRLPGEAHSRGADLLFLDQENDFALLRLYEGTGDAAPLELGDSASLHEGQSVRILSQALRTVTATDGILAFKSEDILAIEGTSDAPVMGGPLLHGDFGTVGGVICSCPPNEAFQGPEEGMHCAVPINRIREVLIRAGYTLD